MKYIRPLFIALSVVFITHSLLKPASEPAPTDFRVKASLIPYDPGVLSKDSLSIRTLILPDGARCTGFVIDSHYLITAAHCITDPSKPVRLAFSPNMYTVLAVLRDRDAALIGGNFGAEARAEVGFEDTSESFGRGMAVGYPGGNLTLTYSKIFSVRSRNGLLFGKGNVYHGMSGGPLVVVRDGHIRIVGIIRAIDVDGGAVFSPVTGLDAAFGIK